MEQPRIEGTAGTLHQLLVHDELGVVEDTRINPWQQGAQIGIAFVVGVIPMVLYVIPLFDLISSA